MQSLGAAGAVREQCKTSQYFQWRPVVSTGSLPSTRNSVGEGALNWAWYHLAWYQRLILQAGPESGFQRHS